MAKLFAITYPDSDSAKQAMESIDWSDFDKQIDVKAACWITKVNGELKVHTRGHPVAGKASLGGALGLVVGGLFAIPVVGIAAGTAIGIHRGRKNEIEIDKEFIETIGAQLESGGSAVLVLAEGGADTGKAVNDLAQYGGTLHSADLSSEQFMRFQATLDQDTHRLEPSDDTTASS